MMPPAWDPGAWREKQIAIPLHGPLLQHHDAERLPHGVHPMVICALSQVQLQELIGRQLGREEGVFRG